jgi:hypothetical protein
MVYLSPFRRMQSNRPYSFITIVKDLINTNMSFLLNVKVRNTATKSATFFLNVRSTDLQVRMHSKDR